MKVGPVPYTILRATQLFEFAGRIADSRTDGDTVRLPPVFVQPEAADDVASTLTDLAVGSPLNDTVEQLAGPEAFRLDDLARRVLEARDDPRQVRADVHARCYAGLDNRSLIPGDDARIASTRLADWLSRSQMTPTRFS